jgi:hypothetical protein
MKTPERRRFCLRQGLAQRYWFGQNVGQLPFKSKALAASVGRTTPLVGRTTPLVGRTTPLVGRTTPLVGRTTHLVGRTTPLVGRTTPLVGRTTPLVGRTTHLVGRTSLSSSPSVGGQHYPLSGPH